MSNQKALYEIFERIPAEVRQEAYDYFMSLPPFPSSPQWRMFSSNLLRYDHGVAKSRNICPLGAVNIVLGADDQFILVGLFEGLTSCNIDAHYLLIEQFTVDYDQGIITDLALAMGVKGETNAQSV